MDAVAETVEVREKLGWDEAREIVTGWHDEADRRWRRRSFHNREHVSSTIEAAEAAVSDEGDMFGFGTEVEKWNRGHELQIGRDDLAEAMRWHWLLHDSGNILAGVKIGAGGKPEPDYLEAVYAAAGAEDRSKAIEAVIVPDRLLPLVQHLTEMTRMGADMEAPFARQVQLIDQVGTYLLRRDRQTAVAGLLEEWREENPEMAVSPRMVMNFPADRLEQLVPAERRQAVVRIWGGKPLERVSDLADERVGIDEALLIVSRQAKIGQA